MPKMQAEKKINSENKNEENGRTDKSWMVAIAC